MSLNTTVQRLRNKENDQQAVKADRDAFIAQWVTDVAVVYGWFEEAMKPFVDDGAAQLSRGQTFISEDLVGEYEIQTLVIEIIGRRVLLVPQARITIGGTGRLDLYREDRPSEGNRLLIVRGAAAADHKPDLWMVQDRRKEPNLLQAAFLPAANIFERVKLTYRYLDDEAIQDSVDYLLNV